MLKVLKLGPRPAAVCFTLVVISTLSRHPERYQRILTLEQQVNPVSIVTIILNFILYSSHDIGTK